jgi:DNA-binding CsgD family transcriptional regulator
MVDFKLQLFNSHQLHIPELDFLSLLTLDNNQFVFVKNRMSVYQYANPVFMEVMGITRIHNQTDFDLCRDKRRVKIYQQHDEQVLASEQILSVSEEILPQKNKRFTKRMIGKIYPVYASESGPIAVLGIVKPQYLPFKLTLELAVSCTTAEMAEIFVKRSYEVVVHNQTITLSKRELQCIIELLKGKHAGEIAEALSLKQTTIEFYLENIKNKLGATNRSSLISTVFDQKIIQQIIL